MPNSTAVVAYTKQAVVAVADMVDQTAYENLAAKLYALRLNDELAT